MCRRNKKGHSDVSRSLEGVHEWAVEIPDVVNHEPSSVMTVMYVLREIQKQIYGIARLRIPYVIG
jgi:hypothetical protein